MGVVHDNLARFERHGETVDVCNNLETMMTVFEILPQSLNDREANIDSKRADAEIRRQAVVFETISDGVLLMDLDYRIVDWNPAAERMFGYTRTEMIGKHPIVLHHPSLGRSVESDIQRSVNIDGRWAGELPFVRKDGSEGIADVVVVLQRDHDGRAISVVGVNRDVTERRRSDAALYLANRRAITEYERLLDQLATLAQSFGAARSLNSISGYLREFALATTSCSRIYVSLFDSERRVRTPVYAFVDGDEKDVSKLGTLELTDSAQSRAIVSGEIIIQNVSGQAARDRWGISGGADTANSERSVLVVPMSVMGRIVGAIEIQSVAPNALTQENATTMRMAANLAANAAENVRLLEQEHVNAEQLRQSQKMEAIGRLAGGVAHDFNNLLTAINGYCDLSLRKLRRDDPLFRNIEEIRRAGDRATGLTRQLLAFSRKQVMQPKILDLNSIVTDLNKMLHRLIGEDIELQTKLRSDLWQLKADPGQIEQVIVNLAVNARDAMPLGGKLIIETANVDIHDTLAMKFGIAAGQYVTVSVADTGIGMDEKTCDRVFEPFFTTKDVDKGTGLGLSTVYGIASQSGGHVTVESKLDRGTTFRLYLPRVEGESVAVRRISNQDILPRGAETILLVEDEQMVRDLASQILKMCGFQTLIASNGGEALLLCEQFNGEIQLMVTDVVMPNMSGRVLAERVAELRPSMKVLYMSGYTENVFANQLVSYEGIGFLQKPFMPDVFVRRVREILDAAN
jgi:PAS domain S-box-containing protein